MPNFLLFKVSTSSMSFLANVSMFELPNLKQISRTSFFSRILPLCSNPFLLSTTSRCWCGGTNLFTHTRPWHGNPYSYSSQSRRRWDGTPYSFNTTPRCQYTVCLGEHVPMKYWFFKEFIENLVKFLHWLSTYHNPPPLVDLGTGHATHIGGVNMF